MIHPSHWNQEKFYTNLQHAVDLEFWTLPLYLTSLYSIQGLENLEPRQYPSAAKLLASIAAQEMLHLEIACNLCNALGYSPQFNKPVYSEANGIPFLKPHQLPNDISGFAVKPGALNENSIKLFCAIELPEQQTHRDWNDDETYDSIAHLYEALYIAVNHLWQKCFIGAGKNNKQKNSFNVQHHASGIGVSQQVNSLEDAHAAIEAIIEQGEGANTSFVKPDYRPVATGDQFDLSSYEGALSHYQKLRILLHHKDRLPLCYELNENADATEQQLQLQKTFTAFKNSLQESFSTEGNALSEKFWPLMFDLKNKIAAVWQAGAVPQW